MPESRISPGLGQAMGDGRAEWKGWKKHPELFCASLSQSMVKRGRGKRRINASLALEYSEGPTFPFQ